VTNEPEKQLARRQITDDLPDSIVETHSLPEILRTAMAKSPFGPIPADIAWEKTELWFDRLVTKRLNGEQIVYGYEHAALRMFENQKKRGGLCIYEMPICHHATTAELLEPEFEKFPELNTKLEQHLRKQLRRRNIRKEAELQLADLVVVNSRFTRDSLVKAGVDQNRILVIPLGAPDPVHQARLQDQSRFIFLSAGTQSVRKGVHYLLESWKKLKPANDVQLWLVGHMDLPKRLLSNLPGNVIIRKSVPKAELTDIYRSANVLVFPSLAEGFGMVITEAMAHGVPVITTPNTVGPDLIETGTNGFIVPVRNVDALTERMQWCLDNRDELALMGRRAQDAVARWRWVDYRAALAKHLSSFISEAVARN